MSVLLPVFNAERYVRAAVDSILAQTFRDFELIIVDDGSTDASRARLAGLSDPRIVVITQPNMGLPATLNRALRVARGELIARQDADDFSHPERLAVQVVLFDARGDLALVGSGMEMIDETGHRIREYRYPERHEQLVAALGRGINPFPHSSIIFRRNTVLKVGGYDERFRNSQDFELYLRLRDEACRFASIPQMLCRVRYLSSSQSHRDTEQRKYHLLATLTSQVRRVNGRAATEGPAWEAMAAAFDAWYYRGRHVRYAEASHLRKRALVAFKRRRWSECAAMAARAMVMHPSWLLQHRRDEVCQIEPFLHWWSRQSAVRS